VEVVYLQKLHEKYAGQGLVILGVDPADKRRIALDLLKKHGLTFPCFVDTSTKAQKLMEGYGVSAWPTNYIIDKEGKIVTAWMGFSEDHEDTKAALQKLGLE
jgi:peroxiredoxin